MIDSSGLKKALAETKAGVKRRLEQPIEGAKLAADSGSTRQAEEVAELLSEARWPNDGGERPWSATLRFIPSEHRRHDANRQVSAHLVVRRGEEKHELESSEAHGKGEAARRALLNAIADWFPGFGYDTYEAETKAAREVLDRLDQLLKERTKGKV